MAAPRKYSNELRERAQRMVAEARGEDPGLSLNAAVLRIGPRVGVNADTLRGWIKRAAVGAGEAPGTTTSDAATIKALEREVRELKWTNEMADSTGCRNTCRWWRCLMVRRQQRADRAVRPVMRSPGRPPPPRAAQRAFSNGVIDFGSTWSQAQSGYEISFFRVYSTDSNSIMGFDRAFSLLNQPENRSGVFYDPWDDGAFPQSVDLGFGMCGALSRNRHEPGYAGDLPNAFAWNHAQNRGC